MARARAWGGARHESGIGTWDPEIALKNLEHKKADFDQACVLELPAVFQTLRQLALGVWTTELVPNSKGGVERRVYEKLPNERALFFLAEHGIGKAAAKSPTVADRDIRIVFNHPRPGQATPPPLDVAVVEEPEPEIEGWERKYKAVES